MAYPILTYRQVRARDLFNKVVTQAHHNGEPGMLFLDTANRYNPVPHLYQLEATNPCGEQWLGPYENCCLGSVNLAEMFGIAHSVDWVKLRNAVETFHHFLDDVIQANAYVPAVPQLKKAAEQARRIGLGVMGLADLMYHCGIRYGSDEGQEFAAQVMEFVRYHAMLTSITLAEKRGAFPAIKGSIYDPDQVTWTPPEPISPFELILIDLKSTGVQLSRASRAMASGMLPRLQSPQLAPLRPLPGVKDTVASQYLL